MLGWLGHDLLICPLLCIYFSQGLHNLGTQYIYMAIMSAAEYILQICICELDPKAGDT